MRPRKTADGKGTANSSLKLHAPLDERIDEMVHPRRHVVLNGIHLLGCEERIEDLAVLEVLRRVHAEGDEWTHVAQLDQVARGVALGIAQHLVDRGSAGHHNEPLGWADHTTLVDEHLVLGLRFGEIGDAAPMCGQELKKS